MPTRHNSPIYADTPSPLVDAAPIITLRAAGALIFGKTTTTEFASTVDGGPSTNPHDPTRTPGGSSSGSGAAVGDFQVPISLGTQTGGSTIRPGSFNSIFAIKVRITTSILDSMLTEIANMGLYFSRRPGSVLNDLRYSRSLRTFSRGP